MKISERNNSYAELQLPDFGATNKFRMADPFGFYLRFTELLDWGQE